MAVPRKKTSTTKKAPVARPKPARAPAAKSSRTAAKSPATSSAAKASPVSRAAASPKKPAVAKPAPPKPAATAVAEKISPAAQPLTDRKWLAEIRLALVARREEMLSVVQSQKSQMAQRAGDSADVSDRASEGFEDELAVGLMAIEAAQLDDIEGAIRRIDQGEYGLCMDCGKPIPQKRIEVLPFARRCLACEGNSERSSRPKASAYVESDED